GWILLMGIPRRFPKTSRGRHIRQNRRPFRSLRIATAKMDLLRTLEDPALRLVQKGANQLSSETDEDTLIEEGCSQRRRYKAYTVMQKSGFQHTEYVSIMVNLCRAEIAISLGFFFHGISCPTYAHETEYQSVCHMNVVAAVVGTFTGAVGLGVVHRSVKLGKFILLAVFPLFSRHS
uniref:Uncharacterized protein n=1 Tax=Parascaris univalens TaxID=6257 RepID=A0A915BFU4_PARUN